MKRRLFYLAVVMAITLPDICAGLEAENGETSGARFKAWYNANLANRLPELTDVDAYSLRCGVIHQGRFGHPKMRYDRMILLLPGPIQTLRWGARHQSPIDPNVYSWSISVHVFCAEIIAAVRDWYAKKKDDRAVKVNLPRLVQYRPDGLMPYIKGMEIIA
jgi:hypothetical protein